MRISLLLAALAIAGCGGSSPQFNSSSEPGAGSGGLPNSTGEPQATPLVSAHRGGAAYAPENTLMAFENAIRLGVDQLEADTQLSSDNVLVLIHDDTLDRTTNCTGTVSSQTLSELQACDAAHWFSPGQPTTVVDENAAHPLRGQGVQIPTAEALFQIAANDASVPDISIEIKNIPGESNFDAAGNQIATVLVPLIQQYNLQSRVIVQSFYPQSIDSVKSMDATIRTQFLTNSDLAITAAQSVTFVISNNHDIAAPNFDAPDLNAELVSTAQAAGKRVIPYTTDTIAEIQATAALGVDGLITNFPACQLALQNRRIDGPATPTGVPVTADCPE